MKNRILIIALVSLIFLSCKKELKSSEKSTDSITIINSGGDNSQNALDWPGTYKGITPCANCEGVETELILNQDLTFTIKTKYLGKADDKIFEEQGSFSWDKTGSLITLKELVNRPNVYKVGENKLIQLDMQGNPITGALADKYVLDKQ